MASRHGRAIRCGTSRTNVHAAGRCGREARMAKATDIRGPRPQVVTVKPGWGPDRPLAGYTDEQLEELAETARKAGLRGAHVLGPRSGHAVRIEQARRKRADY